MDGRASEPGGLAGAVHARDGNGAGELVDVGERPFRPRAWPTGPAS